MLDYQTHAAAFTVLELAFASAAGSAAQSPDHSGWAAAKTAVDTEPDCALLGTLLDHLLERCAGGGVTHEHDLLETAAGLYHEAAALLTRAASVRSDFEKLVLQPATATVEKYTAVTADVERLKTDLTDLTSRFAAARSAYQPPYRHVAGHGATAGAPPSTWLWRDLVLSRRTDAVVTALRDAADGTSQTVAFAFGALAGYASNALGSAYQAHAVGGPRRSHPLRDRLASYAIGAHLQAAGATGTLTELRDRLSLGGGGLPAAIAAQIHAALRVAYPDGPADPPDLDHGYVTLLRHLELLDSFGRLPSPVDIDATLLTRILADGPASTGLIHPLDAYRPDPPDGTNPIPPPPPSPGSSTDPQTTSGGCGVIEFIIGVILTLLSAGITKLVTGKWPWEKSAAGETPPAKSEEALKAFLGDDDTLQVVVMLYNLHSNLHAAVSQAVSTLKRIGLLYPEADELDDLMYGGFLTLAAGGAATAHPHRPTPDPDLDYVTYPPPSPLENPQTEPSPYPQGATPAQILHAAPGSALPSVVTIWNRLWVPYVRGAQNGLHADPEDLDSDRGYRHSCWHPQPGTTLATDPIAVVTLTNQDPL